MTQQNAQAQCTSRNASLVDITTEEESRFIQERINASSVWLDLTRSFSGNVIIIFLFLKYSFPLVFRRGGYRPQAQIV